MTARINWGQRTFNFDFPVKLHPEMVERLRGLARITELIRKGTPA